MKIYNFNPLPPCGGRLPTRSAEERQEIFQSTPSVWRETSSVSLSVTLSVISIHSLRVEGDVRGVHVSNLKTDFNPLPPCGGRLKWLKEYKKRKTFQSTPSVWRETDFCCYRASVFLISIHSLRVEGDFPDLSSNVPISYFNPLPPCGGRQLKNTQKPLLRCHFNPLPPCGGRR